MTEIVFKPEKAPVVDGRGLYRAYMNKRPLELLFRARNAGEADGMLQYLFSEQTRGKTLMVPPELFTKQEESDNGTDKETSEAANTAAEGEKAGSAGENQRGDHAGAGPETA